MDCQNNRTIIARNQDVEHIVNAAACMGKYGYGAMLPKRFAMLVTTDVHNASKQLDNALEYLNAMEALDVGICLGDMQGGNFTQNDGSWYYMAVNKSKMPFYTTIGNHDCGNSVSKKLAGTKEEIFDKFIRTTCHTMGMSDIHKTYYSVNFDKYKITLIVMDNYMSPEDRDENGDFLIFHGAECLDQEEVDWLIETLANVPQDHQVILACHSYPDSAVKVVCNWTQEKGGISDALTTFYGKSELVPDVINAWMNGAALEKAYVPVEKAGILPTLKVNADFSGRGKGVFITYLTGHVHRDIIGRSATYPDQNIICLAATANDNWQNYNCDLPRMRGTKAEDCLTVFAVDTEKHQIHLVRVGSNYTVDCVERTVITIAYSA